MFNRASDRGEILSALMWKDRARRCDHSALRRSIVVDESERKIVGRTAAQTVGPASDGALEHFRRRRANVDELTSWLIIEFAGEQADKPVSRTRRKEPAPAKAGGGAVLVQAFSVTGGSPTAIAVGRKLMVIFLATIQSRSGTGVVRIASSTTCTLAPAAR